MALELQMSDEADIIGAMVALLKADTAVAAIAGGDIFAPEMPADAVKRMPLNAIVVQPSGGVPLTAGSDASLDSQRFDIIAFGLTPRDANQLRVKARSALVKTKRRTITNVLVHWINVAGGFFSARERDGLWPESFQSFQVLYSTQEVQP